MHRPRLALRPLVLALLCLLLATALTGLTAARRSGGGFTFLVPFDEASRRKDAILSDLTGTVGPGMLGHVHSLQDDEDLHFALNAPSVGTPVVCELMNALSVPPEAATVPAYWGDRFAQLFAGGRQQVTATGVFRIWPDHPGGSGEAGEGTATSNPPHVIELHPLARLTDGRTRYDLRASIAPIRLRNQEYRYKDPGRWGDIMTHQVDATVVQQGGRQFLQIHTAQIAHSSPIPSCHSVTLRLLPRRRPSMEV